MGRLLPTCKVCGRTGVSSPAQCHSALTVTPSCIPILQRRKLIPMDEKQLTSHHSAEPGFRPRSALDLSPNPHSHATLLPRPFSGLLGSFSSALLRGTSLVPCDPEDPGLLGTCSQHLNLVLCWAQWPLGLPRKL